MGPYGSLFVLKHASVFYGSSWVPMGPYASL